MSVANIWKLQENTAALCRKISQNVGGKYREALGEHRGTVQNDCETLQVSAIGTVQNGCETLRVSAIRESDMSVQGS